MSLLPAPTQEIDDALSGFKHRLVSADGQRRTRWARYTESTYLDGYVGVTAYYGIKEAILTADDFLRVNCITQELES